MDVNRENVQNTANVHETSNSENINEVEKADYISCQQTFFNSASGDRWVQCMLCLKWAHEEYARIDPKSMMISCVTSVLLKISLPWLRQKIRLPLMISLQLLENS
jgi:hypothetical protein